MPTQARSGEGRHAATNHLGERHVLLLDVDRVEVGDAEVLPVERLREVVHLVDVEAAVVDGDCLANHEVTWREVVLDLLVGQLHDDAGERRLDVVPE